MKLNLKVHWLKQLKEAGSTDLSEIYKWRDDANWCEVEIEKFTELDLTSLAKMAQASKEKGSKSALIKINTYNKLKTDLTGTVITRLEPLAQAMRQYIMPLPHKWVFEELSDGQLVPWYVRNIEYHPPDERQGSTAFVSMGLSAQKLNSKVDRNVSWSSDDLGHNVVEMLRTAGVYVETPDIVEHYEKQLSYYKSIGSLTGHQFLAGGQAFDASERGRYYSSEIVSMERDGNPSKVVMDDLVDKDGDSVSFKRMTVSSVYWMTKGVEHDAMEKEDKVALVPIQPYVKVFDLAKHVYAVIHTSNLKAYDYNPDMIDKLILPPERKDLVSILVTGADMQMEDIVRGKTGGIIVICTGPPGTGKTLTAEVFSEQIKRPLYCVQCSQLGTSEKALEESLNTVLSRASRWRAILLIDEADVYTHERGEDIHQNAIVGVFLRVLEHFRGVLFMTSNRDTIIDDAIMSRATAWIRYDYPDAELMASIWRVLADNYEVPLTDKDIAELCKTFSKISGRTIKSLLRLGRLLAASRNGEVDVELISYVSQFIDLDGRRQKRSVSVTAAR